MKSTPISRRLVLLTGLAAVPAARAFGGRRLRLLRTAAEIGTVVGGNGLFHDPDAPVLGNPLGALPIAEFFDYRCPFCRSMHPLLRRLLAEDPAIRFVAKEWPVFGGPSITAARVVLAANCQGKFAAVDNALFDGAGALDDSKIRAAAEKAGVDMVRLNHDLSRRSGDLDRIMVRVSGEAQALGLQGPPDLVIGPYLVPGALSYDEPLKVVAAARAKMKSGE